MKTATLPSVRVDPQFRAEVEQILGEGETLSQFVEAAIRTSVQQRKSQAEFLARGTRALALAKRTGIYVEAEEVNRRLEAKLAAARAKQKSMAVR